MREPVLAVLDWVVRLVAVFGQLVVRPRPAVRYGVVEVPRGTRLPREMRTPPGGSPIRPMRRAPEASMPEMAKAGAVFLVAGRDYRLAGDRPAVCAAALGSNGDHIAGGGGADTARGAARIRGPEIEPAGWFVYLIDISGSTHVGARKRRRRRSRGPAGHTLQSRAGPHLPIGPGTAPATEALPSGTV